MSSLVVTLLHLGALHPVEKGLTLLLALGPFLVLGVVVAVRRRQDAAAEADVTDATDATGSAPEPLSPQQPPTPTD